jgi:hypothetical protein
MGCRRHAAGRSCRTALHRVTCLTGMSHPAATMTDMTHGDTVHADTNRIPRQDDLTIDCDSCALQGTTSCDDCVVTFLLGREADDAVVIDADEARAMRMLERAGLVPSLRFTDAG